MRRSLYYNCKKYRCFINDDKAFEFCMIKKCFSLIRITKKWKYNPEKTHLHKDKFKMPCNNTRNRKKAPPRNTMTSKSGASRKEP